jgi:hypothetical protein
MLSRGDEGDAAFAREVRGRSEISPLEQASA